MMKWLNTYLEYFFFRWGEARFKNGSRYNGYWVEGRRHGYGEAKTYIYRREEKQSSLNNSVLYNHDYLPDTKWSFRSPVKNNQKVLLRIENYSGDWRENERNGFGIIEIEKYNVPPTCLFQSQTPPRATVSESLCYEGCWKNGAYDGWVWFHIIII